MCGLDLCNFPFRSEKGTRPERWRISLLLKKLFLLISSLFMGLFALMLFAWQKMLWWLDLFFWYWNGYTFPYTECECWAILWGDNPTRKSTCVGTYQSSLTNVETFPYSQVWKWWPEWGFPGCVGDLPWSSYPRLSCSVVMMVWKLVILQLVSLFWRILHSIFHSRKNFGQ